jgi:methyl-accepting chemotaxis protein
VVAAEVRSLAQRSAQAAREIKDLIGSSVEQVQQGHQIVHQAGSTMAAVVSEVQSVRALMAHLQESSATQARCLNEVTLATRALDESTQRNQALVQDTAQAAQALQGLAEALNAHMGRFRLSAAQDGGAHEAVVHMAPQAQGGGRAAQPRLLALPG